MKEILESIKNNVNKSEYFIDNFTAEILPETKTSYERIIIRRNQGFGMNFLKGLISVIDMVSVLNHCDLSFFIHEEYSIVIFDINKNVKP